MPKVTLEDILQSEEYKQKLRSARKVGIKLDTVEGLKVFAKEYKKLKILPENKTSTPIAAPRSTHSAPAPHSSAPEEPDLVDERSVSRDLIHAPGTSTQNDLDLAYPQNSKKL